MQIKVNKQGYITDYAYIGSIDGGIEVPDPQDIGHFERHFLSYRVRDGTLEYDEQQTTINERKALCDELRQRRETECFSYINRGQLWYDRLTEEQKVELEKWYAGWLKVTDTLTAPAKPSWLY